MRRRVALGLVSGALAAVALLAGCGGDREPDDRERPGEPDDVPVLVIGDSLTVGARLWGHLEAEMAAAGWRAEVVAEDGRTVDWGLDRVRARDEVPRVVVVGLGTNPGPSAGSFADEAEALVAELVARGAETVVWIPPGDTDDPGRAARAEVLRQAAGGPLRVPDWPAVLAAHPGWVAGDGVHLTATGYRGLSGLVRDELADVPGAPRR